ncbi:Asp-tRNA(Asn)/Glu-tRNA(Gln) amidotransferase subunit GatC [Patescibacteria group bacterium]|nr:Asp-tRNA(Asn)/Glu-tRNA(Gln) amidotransferase subunit GatC [Patescibacteria group bacterium]
MFDVNHIAKLARLGLSTEEEKKFTKELAAILAFVEKLKEVDTQNVEPTAQATGQQNVMRVDESEKQDEKTRGQILANAPETKKGFIKVKAVFE